MEITIKNNKLNYEILKKNGQYFFPSSFVLIFKLVSLYYIVLILISIFRNRFKREFDSCLQFFTNQIAQNVDYINAFEFFYCQIRENKCTNMG